MGSIAANYGRVLRDIADAADVADRDPGDVTVIAVTKTVGIEDITRAQDAGISDFGENRVQEFLGKYGLFPGARWHFIGTLQTNKVKDVVGRAHLIHSVDSLRLLSHIARQAETVGVVQDVLLQVNVAHEESKHGFDPDDVEDALASVSGSAHIRICGLMTMAPFARPEDVRWVFRSLRELRDSLRETSLDGVELQQLSMGMTNDYRVAVEEGATLVRIGGAIFGRS